MSEAWQYDDPNGYWEERKGMTTYSIDASFAVEVTVPGPVAYSGLKSRAAFTLGEEIEADSPEEARDIALQRANEIAEDAKISVAANTPGVTISTDDDGVTQLTFIEGGEVTAQEGNGSATESSAQGNGSATSTGEVDLDDLPKQVGENKYIVEWNGEAVTLFDNRETKQGNQPDLRMVFSDGDDDGFWIKKKDGSKNRATAALLAMINEAS